MNQLHRLAQSSNKLIDLLISDDQRRRDLEHQKVVSADLGAKAFLPEELPHQHLPEHAGMDAQEGFKRNPESQLPGSLELDPAE